MPTAKENLRRILQGLRMVAQKNKGRIRRLETEKLHKYPGFLSRVSSGQLASTFAGFNESLEALGEDIEGFFGLHLAFKSAPIMLLDALVQPKSAETLPPELASSLGCLLEDPPGELVVKELSGEPHPGLEEAVLDHLDSLRYRDAEVATTLAIKTATELAAQTSKSPGWQALYCRSLGIAASACRQLGHLSLANRTLRKALTDAQRWHLLPEEARLTQRVAYLLSDYEMPQFALEIARHAGLLYARAPDIKGVAKALIDEGLMLIRLDRAAEAAKVLERALPALPPSESRYRAAAFCGFARHHQENGDLDAAAKALEAAAALLDENETRSLANVFTRRGEIALARGQLEQAERYFRETRRLAPSPSLRAPHPSTPRYHHSRNRR